jgi:tRNA-binding EMAP/Myf-like protein
MISWNDFEKIDMRSGTIVSVADFPKAKNQHTNSLLILENLVLKDRRPK